MRRFVEHEFAAQGVQPNAARVRAAEAARQRRVDRVWVPGFLVALMVGVGLVAGIEGGAFAW